VALLTFGEGWHNNHHAHPTSARHGLAWYEADANWIGIRTLQALGLAWDVRLARITQPPVHPSSFEQQRLDAEVRADRDPKRIPA
jgi:stearoyl-CoA desaturase (delta-9 desaturase)